MYNVSDFIIAQPLNDAEMLLYSTLSTSIVTLENKIYNDIFSDQCFDEYPDICSQLCEMGFLYTGNIDSQHEALRKMRHDVAFNEHGITSMTIAPTMNCNARCYYCFEKGAVWGTMTRQTAKALADFIIKNCPEKKMYISWFGGEPLIAWEIIDYITQLLVDADIEVESTVTTNGYLMNAEVLSRFSFWNTTRVQITIDGIGEDYNRVKAYANSDPNPFDTVMGNIENAVKLGISVHLRVNYIISDYQHVHETLEYLHNRFGQYEQVYLYAAALELPEKDKNNGFQFSKENGDTFLRLLFETTDRGYWNDELGILSGINVSPKYNRLLGELKLAPFPASCFMTNKYRFAVDDKGNLYKCQKHLGKIMYSCGNVFDGVQENEIYHHFVTDRLYESQCEHCFMLPACQGGCKANRLLYGGQYICPPVKEVADKLVLKYYYSMQNDSQN